MTSVHLKRRALREELFRHRARVARLTDEGALLRASLDQAELRMLMAETPLADRDRVVALARLRAAERDLADLEQRLAHLEGEWALMDEAFETPPRRRP